MNTTKHEFQPEEVMAFLDGELSAGRATALSQHLKKCEECADVATKFRSISQNLSTWRIEPLPDRSVNRVTSAKLAIGTKTAPRPSDLPNPPHLSTLKWGFGTLAGIVVFLLTLAVLTPNLLRSRIAANEASAVGSLRTLNSAADSYQNTYGHYPLSLHSFGPPANGTPSEDAAGLVDPVLAGGQKSGYFFTYRRMSPFGSSGREGYTINADPLNPNSTGVRHFSIDQTGVIRAEPGGIIGENSREKNSKETGQPAQERQFAPMVARTAELRLVVNNLQNAREIMEQILHGQQGYIGQLSLGGEGSSAASLNATLRVPADHMDACLAELKKLGKIAGESQSGQEVTQQHADLVARLQNAHNTETRLNNVIGKHAGSVKDILEVEKESSRVRGEINHMEAEQKSLERRVDFTTIELQISEEYKAQLDNSSPSASTRVHNSLVAGYKNAAETLLGFVLFFAESGPTLLIWLVILLVPAFLLVRRYRRAATAF
jgi:type IV pilus assembly protein PilA